MGAAQAIRDQLGLDPIVTAVPAGSNNHGDAIGAIPTLSKQRNSLSRERYETWRLSR